MNTINRSIKNSIAVLLLFVSFSSCKKFLEEDPKNLVSVKNYYQTQSDAVAAVNSVYAYLNSVDNFAQGGNTAGVYHSTFWVTAGLASDEMENNQVGTPYFDQLATFQYNAQNSVFQELWAMEYKTVTIANIAIARIPSIDMDATLRTRLVGEAKFLRGLMYFDLVRWFGKVPLITQEDAPLYPSLSSVDDVYTQIIADLKDAADALPSQYEGSKDHEIGRATAGAANAILAKVYLTRGDWTNAAAYAKKVIDSQQYALWDDYADVFKLSSRNGKEAIFSVGFGDGGGAISFWEVGQFNVRLLPTELSADGVQNSQGWQRPTQYLYDQFASDDRRRDVTFITQVDGNPIHPYFQKYWDKVAEPTGNGSSNDFPVIRYADVLLMYAEASNELGNMDDAYTYINMVRKRARTTPGSVPDYAGLTQDQFRDAVLKERQLELSCEGHRWFDLVRTHKLETLVPLAKPAVTPTANDYVFPLPQYETDTNPNLK
ncbi:RagB/SusD family nutrient uptake outer membrane protein [Ferruginibacter albus]|uniref:RagB/SusD family nutrient uptake outer membrane protein n=1 Tax=Ferruginibacter albus TaxID=2875540 RepID=UPI001CC74DCD|nr:RagB/SusD family nutrient uptake outer membrane protein [Ferruginibacter albus]UAY51935.1 RagB/SusD family nutrient uptake outer membrane protein [Ferruginibacter albus]